MMDAKTIKAMAGRLEKAEELAVSGAVFPVAGLSGYAVVRNGDGNSMYLVRHDAGQEHCTYPDYTQRQKAAQMPCKHILASQLAAGGTTPEPPSPAAEGVKPARHGCYCDRGSVWPAFDPAPVLCLTCAW